MRIIRIRHRSAPFPLGCRWCGVPKQDHYMQWVPSHKYHQWAVPTPEQHRQRLLVRMERLRRQIPLDPTRLRGV